MLAKEGLACKGARAAPGATSLMNQEGLAESQEGRSFILDDDQVMLCRGP